MGAYFPKKVWTLLKFSNSNSRKFFISWIHYSCRPGTKHSVGFLLFGTRTISHLTKDMEVDQSSASLPLGMTCNWDLRLWTKQDISDKLVSLKKDVTQLYDQVGSLSKENLSYETVMKPLLKIDRFTWGNNWWHGTRGSEISFPSMVAESQELRDASNTGTKELEQFLITMNMRVDVFHNLVAYKAGQATQDQLSPEQMRFLDAKIREGHRVGLHLDAELREKVKTLHSQIKDLAVEFGQNINEDKTIVLLDASELAGVPEDFLANLEEDKANQKKKLTLAYPHYLPIMRKCYIPETRQKMEFAFNNKASKPNEPILKKIIQLREEAAHLLGYKTHAHYKLETNMAKTPETVNQFLSSLATKMQPLWTKEREVFLTLKAKECEERGYDFDGKINAWDTGYYCNMVEEKYYAIDNEKIKEYFPLDVVMGGILGIYSEILSLKFQDITESPVPKWHKDLKCYSVTDKESDELMGYIYFDLFPREGKYSHFCNKPLHSGPINEETGLKEKTVNAMLCNFNPPALGKPSLLDHEEVETFFHEFGHVMHDACSKAKIHHFSGMHVNWDFIEAPSQMLENWVREKEVLERLSSHYKTQEKLPDEWVEKLKNAHNANIGYRTLRQIAMSTFDQKIHTDGLLDPRQTYIDTMIEFVGLSPSENTFFPGHFAHLASTYDASYYAYLWSEVFSVDMYYEVFKPVGPLSKEAGMKYRHTILEKGGTVDAMDLLKEFLGREPNDKAFLASKGL